MATSPEFQFPKGLMAALAMQNPTMTAGGPAPVLSVGQPRTGKKGPGIRYVLDPNSTKAEDLAKVEGGWRHEGALAKSVLRVLNGTEGSVERLAFERDPSRITEFAGIYRPKVQLTPDALLKRIAIQDDLVAAVVHTRSSHTSQFGRKQEDRHAKGFIIDPDESIVKDLDDKHKKILQDRIDRAEKLLLTCGKTDGYTHQDLCSFSEYLYMTTRNAVVVGRSATEVVYSEDPADPKNKEKRRFHSFRPIDAGTIYYAAQATDDQALEQLRKEALRLLAQLKNEKLEPEKFEQDKYAWVQVIDGRPMQAFGPEEMLVHFYYPVTDIELQGYPLTPLDCVLSAVTTHINITTHNKMYFQSGRAARGMLVIKSNDVDVDVVQAVKQQFNASINGVNNAWRMPVFGILPEDDLTWQPIDSGGRDMEFQFLSDSNARTILAAFQMSPEELPGYQHLTRGTNNQALSESNEEYKLTAARDVGIRPLLAKLEDFLNRDILPLIDPDLAKFARIRLVGLDADTEEKESVRLQQDMPLHMTYDEVLGKVEKDPLGPAFTGSLPLNPTVWQNIQMMMTFGEIQEKFMGVKGAAADPMKQFYMNPFWFQWVQMKMQEQQAQQQAQAQAAGGGQPPPGDGGGGGEGGGEQPAQKGEEAGGDLSSGIEQALQVLGGSLQKGERFLPAAKRRLKQRVALTNRAIMDAWRADQHKLVQEIASIADQHKPTR